MLFFATIRDYTGEKETTAPETANIGDLLLGLADRYGKKFRAEAFDGDDLSDRVIIMVNGRHIAHTGGRDTPLSVGDTVAIFPIIGGG